MKTESKNYRRREILCDPSFQLRFAALVGMLILTYFAILAVVPLIGPSLVDMASGDSARAWQGIADRAGRFGPVVLPALLCTAICMFSHAVVLSFRIAGPNYRFKLVYNELAKMRFPHGVKIREKDFMQTTAQELDAALRVVHENVTDLRLLARVTREAMAEAAEENASPRLVAAAHDALESLLDLAERFEPEGLPEQVPTTDTPMGTAKMEEHEPCASVRG